MVRIVPSSKSYQVVKKAVRGMIVSGEHKPGELIPTEFALADRFNVSRPTVHRAMRELMAEGLVRRNPRTGTVVNDPRRFVTGTVAVLSHHELGTAHSLHWLPAMREALLNEGLFIVPYVLGHEPRRAEQFVRMLIHRGVSAAVLAPANRADNRLLGILDSSGVTTVVAGSFDDPEKLVPFVSSNHTQGASLMADHLLELGHRRVAVIGDFANHDAAMRRDGFVSRITAGGGSFPRQWQIHAGDYSMVPQLTSSLMGGRERPTAIFGVNDQLAMEAMATLHGMGLRIPGEISVVGMGGEDWTRATISPMTTVEVPLAAEGSLIARTILSRLAHPELPAEHVELDCRLIVRESSGAPAA